MRWTRLTPLRQAADAVFEFRCHVLGDIGLVLLEEFLRLGDGNLGGLAAVLGEAVAVGDEDEFRGLERFGNFQRHPPSELTRKVRAIAIEAERGG